METLKAKIEAIEAKIMASPFAETQELINAGQWNADESIVNRMNICLNAGCCMLGKLPATDRYGYRVPSRYEAIEGKVGSPEFVEERIDNLIKVANFIITDK